MINQKKTNIHFNAKCSGRLKILVGAFCLQLYMQDSFNSLARGLRYISANAFDRTIKSIYQTLRTTDKSKKRERSTTCHISETVKGITAAKKSTDMGFFQAVYAIGMTVLPALCGLLADSFSTGIAYAVLAVIYVAGRYSRIYFTCDNNVMCAIWWNTRRMTFCHCNGGSMSHR